MPDDRIEGWHVCYKRRASYTHPPYEREREIEFHTIVEDDQKALDNVLDRIRNKLEIPDHMWYVERIEDMDEEDYRRYVLLEDETDIMSDDDDEEEIDYDDLPF